MLHHFIKRVVPAIAPLAVAAMAAGVAGCDGMDVRFGDKQGVPLAELDMSGDPPTGLVLASSDTVVLRTGDALDIDVSGDPEAVDRMRFAIEDGSLAIAREKGSWGRGDDRKATINVTMPAPGSLVLAGSGVVEADELASEAEIVIAGSGELRVRSLAAEKVALTVAGSGDVRASGAVRNLDMTIAGSGNADLSGVEVETADLSIAGSGTAAFASDGTVDASIMGSGRVTVTGNATCEVDAMGSGKLVCQPWASSERSAASDANEE